MSLKLSMLNSERAQERERTQVRGYRKTCHMNGEGEKNTNVYIKKKKKKKNTKGVAELLCKRQDHGSTI